MDSLIVSQKRCYKCSEIKPSAEFNKNKNARDGLQSYCRACEKILRSQYQRKNRDRLKEKNDRWQRANPDKVREYSRRYRAANPDKVRERFKRWGQNNPDKLREKGRRYSAAHRELNRQRNRLWYQSNADKVRERNRRFRLANPDNRQIQRQRHLARKRSLPSTMTTSDWKHALGYWLGVCAYCGKPPSLFDVNWTLHQDHFIPAVKSGGYTPDNILPACQSCNLNKQDKDPSVWLVERFGATKGKQKSKRITAYFQTLQQK